MAVKCNMLEKPVKERIERSVNDNCRLCCCLLKIKFGECKEKVSWMSAQGFFQTPWTNKKCQSSLQAVSQLSLSQAPFGFGTCYRGFAA